MRRATDRSSEEGFTLVEMIVSIVVGGILVALVAMFGRWQIQSYFDVSARTELADGADTALRRIGRELQSALPNSVRVTLSGTGSFLEYVPIATAGRYRADVGLSGTENILDFADAGDTSFEILGPPINIASGQQLVIYNLGIPHPAGTYSGSDVYQGDNRRSIPAAGVGNSLTTVNFTKRTAPSNLPLPFASPANRFHIVGGPVSFECAPNAADPAAGQIIRRWCYAFQDSQPTGGFGALSPYTGCAAVQSAVLVNNVASCSISYDGSPALQRNGLVSLNLTLSANGEAVNLLHQVEVLNTP